MKYNKQQDAQSEREEDNKINCRYESKSPILQDMTICVGH